MSTTDNAFSATLEPIDTPKTTLKQRWWHIMDNWKVGIVPLPLFLLAGGLIALDCLGGKLPSDIVVMVATLAFFGFACGEFGKRLPVLGKLGAAAICATFIPSALVHYGLLPDVVCYEGNHLILPGREGNKRESAGLLASPCLGI